MGVHASLVRQQTRIVFLAALMGRFYMRLVKQSGFSEIN
jgi:hypothetical protein